MRQGFRHGDTVRQEVAEKRPDCFGIDQPCEGHLFGFP